MMKMFTNLFKSNEKTPEDFMQDLKIQETSLKRRKAGLEIDGRKSQSDLQMWIAKAADAQRKGETLKRKEAAMEIRAARSYAGQILNERLTNIKTLSVVKLTSRKLESSIRNKDSMKVGSLKNLLNDPKLNEIIANHEMGLEDFNREVEILFNSIEDEPVQVSDTCDDVEILIERMVEEQEKGNLEEVQKIQAQLSGESDLLNS